MVIALDTKWIWDSWYAHDGQKWHAYFLQADKAIGDPELRHWNVSQGHASSADLVNWQHLGTCFTPSPGPAWDDYATWTGSVVRDDDSMWHLFYTGSSHAEDGLIQRIGHATSTDMHDWERVGDGLCLDLVGEMSAFYEANHAVGFWHDRAMRDPWVMRDPSDGGWLMYFTARAPDIAEPNAGGAIGFATSPNLRDWSLQKPVHVGGFGQLEVPQVFEHSGNWYCLFSTSASHFSKNQAEAVPGGPVTGTHYLIARDARGPWRIATGPFLDGALPCRRYAARIVLSDQGPVIMGFADRPTGGAFGGYVMDPEPVVIDKDGRLRVETEFTPTA